MKKIAIIMAATLFASAAMAQVKYKLTRQADNQTYMVSMVPEVTWTFPKSITLNAQVAVKVPASAHFIAGRITSLVAETRWLDNAYVEKPNGDKNSNYVLFNLQTQGTKDFTFDNSREVPLFTFQNIGTTCFGNLELVDNTAATTKAVVASGFNVTQSFATMGADGEAFAGIVGNSQVGCSGTTSVQDGADAPLSILKAFPIPAKTDLTVQWQLADEKVENLKLEVTNELGQVVSIQGLTAAKGIQTTEIDVQDWAEGVYFFRLVSKNGASKAQSFVVMH
jgi:hypothetical protein